MGATEFWEIVKIFTDHFPSWETAKVPLTGILSLVGGAVLSPKFLEQYLAWAKDRRERKMKLRSVARGIVGPLKSVAQTYNECANRYFWAAITDDDGSIITIPELPLQDEVDEISAVSDVDLLSPRIAFKISELGSNLKWTNTEINRAHAIDPEYETPDEGSERAKRVYTLGATQIALEMAMLRRKLMKKYLKTKDNPDWQRAIKETYLEVRGGASWRRRVKEWRQDFRFFRQTSDYWPSRYNLRKWLKSYRRQGKSG